MDSQNFYSNWNRILQIQQEKGIVGDKPYWQSWDFPPFPEEDEDQNIDNEDNSTSLIEEDFVRGR